MNPHSNLEINLSGLADLLEGVDHVLSEEDHFVRVIRELLRKPTAGHVAVAKGLDLLNPIHFREIVKSPKDFVQKFNLAREMVSKKKWQ